MGTAGGTHAARFLLVPGVVAGFVLWGVILACGTAALGSGCSGRTLRLINRVAGIVIVLFGIVTIAGILR